MKKRAAFAAVTAVGGLLGASDGMICSFGTDASSYRASDDQSPTRDALDLAGHMNSALAGACSPGCPKMALLRNASAPNLMLVQSGGNLKLVYAPQFLSSVDDTYGDGAVVAMIAHEYGHALDAKLADAWPKEFTPEMRADAWAACALAQDNTSAADLKGALGAMEKYPPRLGSGSTPTWASRLSAIKLGWSKCAGDAAKLANALK